MVSEARRHGNSAFKTSDFLYCTAFIRHVILHQDKDTVVFISVVIERVLHADTSKACFHIHLN